MGRVSDDIRRSTHQVAAPLVRPSTVADVAAICSIYRYYVLTSTATFETEPPTLDQMTARHDAVVSSGLPFLVAEFAGSVVGYAYASPYRVRAAYRYTLENSIYVQPTRTRIGAGSALMRVLLAECSSTPARQLVAIIGDSSNAASVALHLKFGFRHAGVLTAVGFKFDRWIDTVLMQRPLPYPQ